MSDINTNGPIDLGSDPLDEFDPFASDDELGDDGAEDTTTDTHVQQPVKPQTQVAAPASKQSGTVADSDNPLATAIDNAETKDAEKAKLSLKEKPPVFDFAGALEDIQDITQTFEELRIAKAADFPELDDGKRVNWTIEYGKITKHVNGEKEAKGMTIGKMKSDIEASKEFTDALKKAKDNNPVCKIKPRVTAQSKGVVSASGYKGVFTCMDDVEAAGKVISYLPAKDGKVYEIRNNALGRFITPVTGCSLLSDVRAGFTPASGIPLIPMALIIRIISFFRSYTCDGVVSEVLVNVYWDSQLREFIVDAPEQVVSKISVQSNENPDYQNERFIHYMDIHSHNSMEAFFSPTDNKDEKATRLYTVIGRLDNYFPEIKTRISNGGKFHEIDPGEVFEYISRPFPDEWKDKVTLRTPHKNINKSGIDCTPENRNHHLDSDADGDSI